MPDVQRGTVVADLELGDTRHVPFRVEDEAFIPAERYYDPAFHALESEKLWKHTWQPACRLDEIPETGDFTVYDIVDQSYLIVRDGSDSVSAFHNSCRHRGTALGCGTGSFLGGQIACPFHGWRYDLHGTNTFVHARRYFRPDSLVQAAIDLQRVHVGTRYGFVWINPDPDAHPFDDSFRGVDAALGPMRLDLMRVNWWQQVHLEANWKIAQEAFFEAYHLSQTHPQAAMFAQDDEIDPGLASGYATDPQGHGWAANQRVKGATGERVEMFKGVSMREFMVNSMRAVWDGSQATVMEWQVEIAEDVLARTSSDEEFFETYYREMYDEAARRRQPIPALSPDMTGHCTVFPNFTLAATVGSALLYRSRPTGPDTCLYDFWSLSIPPEGTPVTRPVMGAGPDLAGLWFVQQDISNIERQQIGLHTAAFEGMRLAPYLEKMISNWHQALDRTLATP